VKTYRKPSEKSLKNLRRITPGFLRQELFGDLDAEEMNLIFPPSDSGQVKQNSLKFR
jgi:hypothetical protein